jgi:hypothetical protein
VLAFSIFQTINTFLLKKHVELSPIVEKIGRIIFGGISGIIIAGVVIVTVGLSSINKPFLYERFSPNKLNLSAPGKAFLGVDDLITGMFRNFSRGSLHSKHSFAVIHPNFLNETYLNYLSKSDEKNIKILSSKQAIEINKKAAIWFADKSLKDTNGNVVTPKTGHYLVILRAAVKKNGAPFSLSQLRLSCNDKNADKPLTGNGVSVYPIGFILNKSVDLKEMNTVVSIESSEFVESKYWMDFVFNVPDDMIPVVLAFKQNNFIKLPKLLDSEQAANEIISANASNAN